MERLDGVPFARCFVTPVGHRRRWWGGRSI